MTDPAAHDSPSERDVDDGIASHDITCVVCGRSMVVRTDASGHLCAVPCRCAAESATVAATNRDVEPLDLDAIEARNFTAARYVAEGDEYAGFTWDSARDVPGLVAEVRRLRDELAAQETSTCHLGDLLRATVNALRGEPPPLTTWSTHDLPDVARAVREERDAAVAEARRLAPRQRAGQLVFNALAEVDADFAERIRGTELSPFYRDEVTADTLRAWRDSLVAAAEKRADNDALRARVAELERLAAGPATREPMGFAEALDAVRRGPVGPSGCARCGEIATAACDACGVHLCSVCGATPTCDGGDPCALRRYPHPDKEPLLCVDLDAWGRALG